MIGRTTFFWLLLAALAGYGLFQVKYKVVSLEEELTRLNTATLREQNQIHVLEAEWSYLNQPTRLEDLNDRYVHLKPIAPQQFGSIATLPMRPEPNPDEKNHLPGTAGMVARILPPRRPALPAAPAPAAPVPSYATAAAKAPATQAPVAAPSAIPAAPVLVPVSAPR
ncbi:MAG TPA: hypothetical protein VGO34_01950 [Alphaproteobacteria bacterium]|jgi:hypothetical protein